MSPEDRIKDLLYRKPESLSEVAKLLRPEFERNPLVDVIANRALADPKVTLEGALLSMVVLLCERNQTLTESLIQKINQQIVKVYLGES
jgi:hypothetical protein